MSLFFILVIYPVFVIWYWKKRNPKKYEKVILLTPVILAFIWWLVLQPFVMKPLKMTGEDMNPSISNGQFFMMNRLSVNNFERGEIIVFNSKDNQRLLVKRVVGLPSEEISISGGKVYINGSALDESSYLISYTKTSSGQSISEGQTLKIPNDQYFVLGDNRNNSKDSREWGTLPKQNIVGVFWFKY